MNAKRIEVYRSSTAVLSLSDVQALAPDADLDTLVESIGAVIVDTFGDAVVGYTYDPARIRLLITFKFLTDAQRLVTDWEAVVALVQSQLVAPD
jgi:hypothetical protein